MDFNDACRSLPLHLPDWFDRIAADYARMDAAYDTAAAHVGFTCSGCEDNCCRTRFRHHTLIEYAYLRQGFEGLGAGHRRRVGADARRYLKALQEAESQGNPFRHWCPLNHDGRCILYPYRPMICRLHGLPHILHHPVRGMIQGTGCHVFEQACRRLAPRLLDRTGIYQRLAGLERAVRQATGFSAPLGMTVAEMILAMEGGIAGVREVAAGRGGTLGGRRRRPTG